MKQVEQKVKGSHIDDAMEFIGDQADLVDAHEQCQDFEGEISHLSKMKTPTFLIPAGYC